MTTAPHPGTNDWFEAVRSEPAPRWSTRVHDRCRHCGALGHVDLETGRMQAVHAGIWSYNCSARPWWTFGRGHQK